MKRSTSLERPLRKIMCWHLIQQNLAQQQFQPFRPKQIKRKNFGHPIATI